MNRSVSADRKCCFPNIYVYIISATSQSSRSGSSSLFRIRNFRKHREIVFFFPSRMQSFDALSMVLANLSRLSISPARSIWHLLISGQLKMQTPWSVLQEAKLSGCVYVRLHRCLYARTLHCIHSFSPPHVPSLLNAYSWSNQTSKKPE